MVNVAAPVLPTTSELARLVCEHVDDLVTYAAHLVGDPDEALEFVAGGIHHASKYPPARLSIDGRAALYRAVGRACRQQHRFPPRPHGPARFFRRARGPLLPDFDGTAAARINTVKRALMAVAFERRAALLLRDLVGLDYREMAIALECSPEAAARLVAGARREFGTVYREIAI